MRKTRQVHSLVPKISLPDVELHFVIGDSIFVSYVDNQIKQLCGFSADDFLNDLVRFQELIHPDDSELSQSLFSQKVHDSLIKINFRISRKNGRIKCLKGTYKKYKKNDSSEIILILLLQDAASLKQDIEESMLLANFSAMMEVTDDYIYFKDRNHVFTGASQTLVSLTDPSEHWTDLIGLTDYDVFPKEYADKYYSLEKQIFSGEVSVAHEIQPTLDNKGKSGWVDNRKYPIKDKDGIIIGLFGIARDITEREEMLENIEWQATHDPLTSLPNRTLLADRFKCAIGNAKRSGKPMLICMLDLDGFKPVNDTFGHEIGDKLIVQVARRLEKLIRSADTACRIGGDEFVLLLCDLDIHDEMNRILQRILESLAEPFVIDSNSINITASIGASIYPTDDVNPDTLLRRADQAMYMAKQTGRNCVHWFDVGLNNEIQGSLDIINKIKQALEKKELSLCYQPKVNMLTHEIIGMEALLRWQHPEKGEVLPLDFLPLIEQTELIIDIGDWVIHQALNQIQKWSDQGYRWTVSVNIAAKHFQLADFHTRLESILMLHQKVAPQQLEIEILESVAFDDIDQVHDLIIACQKLGIKFALDDFGTGYSSLSYLKRLSADTLKIDQSFVRDILDNKDDLALVKAIINLAHNFKRNVIAEGVESQAHGKLLVELGCDLAQGYGIAKPMVADNVAEWAENFKRPDSH